MRINVDPDTSSSGFGYANPGRYRLRVAADAEMKEGPKGAYLNWRFEFADPNVKPVDPEAKKVGTIFEITTLKKGDNAQFRLKQLCDALGRTWGDFDTSELIGHEFEAEVDIETYQENIKNVVKRYIPAGK